MFTESASETMSIIDLYWISFLHHIHNKIIIHNLMIIIIIIVNSTIIANNKILLPAS